MVMLQSRSPLVAQNVIVVMQTEWCSPARAVALSKELPLTCEIKVQLGCIFHFLFSSRVLQTKELILRGGARLVSGIKREMLTNTQRAQRHTHQKYNLSVLTKHQRVNAWLDCMQIMFHVAIKCNFSLSQISVHRPTTVGAHADNEQNKVGSCAAFEQLQYF